MVTMVSEGGGVISIVMDHEFVAAKREEDRLPDFCVYQTYDRSSGAPYGPTCGAKREEHKMSDIRPQDESEFGGAPGMIQPPPHDVNDSASEQRMLIVATDPSNPESGIDEVRESGRFGRTD